LHPQYLHETAKNISIALATNFNISMETMKLPESWKEANVTPIQKKGPKHLVENDRPISLTSIVCKTMDEFIRSAFSGTAPAYEVYIR
jgi:hypothetical protein